MLNLPIGGSNKEFKRAPAGTHVAICNLIADLGLQPGSGEYPDPKQQVYFRFEIPAERVTYEKDGKEVEGPQTIGRPYTASLGSKANLRKAIEGWIGKKLTDDEARKFDIHTLLARPCMLSIVENERDGKTYANIASISGLPKGFPAPKLENKAILYDNNTGSGFDDLPKWLQEKVNGQLSSRGRGAASSADSYADSRGQSEDEIPF